MNGGFFTDYAEAGNKNTDNVNADLYSILDTLDFYRGVDGKFLFKLCYPELEGKSGGHCNEWYQTSNPFTEPVITGFEKVLSEFDLKTPGQSEQFGGLGQNPSDSDSSALSNDPSGSPGYMAIGAFKGVTVDGTDDTLPGPAEAKDQAIAVTVVELFVSKARLNPKTGVGLDGNLTVRCNEPGEDLDAGYNLKELTLTCTRG